MTRGFSRIFTDQNLTCPLNLAVMTSVDLRHSSVTEEINRKKIRVNPCKSAAKVSA
jgi:hypothetical protein